VGEIPLTGWQVPVKGNHTNIKAVDHNPDYGPESGPFNQCYILIPNPDRIKKTGQP
jgi:hypothetical protein